MQRRTYEEGGKPTWEVAWQAAAARAKWYSLAGTLLNASPSREAVEEVLGEEFRACIADWIAGDAIAALNQAAAERPCVDALGEAYEELFVIPGPNYLTPYESVFRDSRVLGDGQEVRGLTFGPSTDDVIRYYQAAGLRISDHYDELPDHVGLEVEFMRYLCEREAEALNEGDAALACRIGETQIGFLERHLTAWLPDLLATARERSAHPFYVGLLALLSDFTRSDLEYLQASDLTQLP